MLGESDVTSQFDQYDVLVKGEGPPGLQSLYYKVDVYNKAMAFDYSHNEKLLKCTSSLFESDLPNSVAVSSTQRTSSIRITLLCKNCCILLNSVYSAASFVSCLLKCSLDIGPLLVNYNCSITIFNCL
jgi:hypothetical protein